MEGCDNQDSGSISDVIEDQKNLSNIAFMEFKNTSDSDIKIELEKGEIENALLDMTSFTCINESIQPDEDKLVVKILKNSLDHSYRDELVTAKYEELFPNQTVLETENSATQDMTFDMCKIKNEEVDVKAEELEINETRCKELFSNQTISQVKTENSETLDMWNIKNEEVDIKEEEVKIDDTSMSSTEVLKTRQQEILVRKFQNQHNPALEKVNLKRNHLRHINPKRVAKMFKYDFTPTCRQNLNKHQARHNTKETFNNEGSLEKHLFMHRHSEEDTILKGNVCDKNPVNMFQCNQCDYKSLRKSNLKVHLLRHRNPEEVKMFKCDQCDYKSFRKCHLKVHLLRHRNPEEVNMFKCNQCDYKSFRKCDLTHHLLRHKKPEEVNLFKCDQCDYKSFRKCDLKVHLLRHKKPEEVNMFKCNQCDYKSPRKSDMQKHLLLHKNLEEVNMFKCDQCDYKSLRKSYLKVHLLRHRNPGVNIFKCDLCDYKTLQKGRLEQHLSRHKRPEEVNMVKGD